MKICVNPSRHVQHKGVTLHNLEADIRIRISPAMKAELHQAAAAMGEGFKISDVVRVAINQYLVARSCPELGRVEEKPADYKVKTS